jgi:acyl dehydratase
MPIHADPAVANLAGFERPIAHGLHSMGLACRALLKHFLPGRPQALRGMAVRFVGAGYPGDTIRVELERRGDLVRFRARALERDVLLLDRGSCWLHG